MPQGQSRAVSEAGGDQGPAGPPITRVGRRAVGSSRTSSRYGSDDRRHLPAPSRVAAISPVNMSRIVANPLFADRAAAGRALAVELGAERGGNVVVVGLARGGVEVAAEIARALGAPLDVVAVRKIGHPFEREYGIGAVTPGDGVYVRASDGLSAERLAVVVEETKAQAARLDRSLHAEHAALDLRGRTVLLIDDGLATGATMVAAVRWAKAAEAGRVVVGVPVAASASIPLLRREADDVVVLYPLASFFSVSSWYEAFPPVHEAEVVRLIDASRTHDGR